MDTLPLYCATCGAANQAGTGTCFACGQSLQAAAQADPYPRVGPLAPCSLLNRRYRIISQVGTGGFGAVYKATDTQSGDQLVAIKEINLRGLKPQEIIEATDSFNREVTLLTDLTHPHLPKVYEHFTDPEHWYLVMDFIEGETLETILDAAEKTENRAFSLDEALSIGLQL